jgi:hypothetical protein
MSSAYSPFRFQRPMLSFALVVFIGPDALDRVGRSSCTVGYHGAAVVRPAYGVRRVRVY